MIKEIVNFIDELDSNFFEKLYRIRPGLHILVKENENNELKISEVYYSDNKENERLNIYDEIAFYERQSDYISLNKQQKFDKQQKIHSASPFSVAFNFSLGSKKKEIEINLEAQKNTTNESIEILSKKYKIKKVLESLDNYFVNAKQLCDTGNLEIQNKLLDSFKDMVFRVLIDNLEDINNKFDFEDILSTLKTKDYVRFYLSSVPKNKWKKAYSNYYNKEIPTDVDEDSNFNTLFLNTSYPDKKPFLKHQTAPFLENFKIDNTTNNNLELFKKLTEIKPSILPNPLPLFVYKDELKSFFSILKENNYKLGYKEVLANMITLHNDEIHNYYLLNWQKGMSNVLIIDFDFVSKFEFYLPKNCKIINLFELKVKDENRLKTYTLNNIFDLESYVFKPLLQNKYHKLDYFGDLKKDDYTTLDQSFSAFSKYRKAVYDYVYKSKKEAIGYNAFREMVFNRLSDLLKQNNAYGIKEILNIWFNLGDFFNPLKKQKSMTNYLKNYRDFVTRIISGEEIIEATDEQFAFISGQVIDYLLAKSKTADTGYGLLEPYTQQSKVGQFKMQIANDFDRYKHENYSRNFERAASFVLTYKTESNLKQLLPEILAGVFSDNQLYSNFKNQD